MVEFIAFHFHDAFFEVVSGVWVVENEFVEDGLVDTHCFHDFQETTQDLFGFFDSGVEFNVDSVQVVRVVVCEVGSGSRNHSVETGLGVGDEGDEAQDEGSLNKWEENRR